MWSINVLLVMLTGVVFIPVLIFIRRRGNADLFEPIYWATAYFFLIFILRSVYLMYFGSPFLGVPPFPAETIESWSFALIYLILAFLLFLAGYYFPIGVAVADALPRIPRQWSILKIKLILPILFAFGLTSFAMLVQYMGGFTYYVTHKQETLTAGGTTYLSLGISLLNIVLIIGWIVYFHFGKLKWVTFGVLLPVVFMQGIVSGSKSAFLSPFLALIIVYHYLRRPIPFKYIVIFFVVVLLIFPFFNIYRNVNDLSQILAFNLNGQQLIQNFMSRFHMMDSLIYIIRDTPRVMDYQLGKTVIPILYSWIPRQLWPEKPVISFGKVFAETYYGRIFAGTGTAASATILGEAYINLHLGGLLPTAFILGCVLRLIYHYLMKSNFGDPALLVYSSQFLYFFTFWESNVVAFMIRSSIAFTLVLLVGMIIAKNRRYNSN